MQEKGGDKKNRDNRAQDKMPNPAESANSRVCRMLVARRPKNPIIVVPAAIMIVLFTVSTTPTTQ